MKRRTGIIVILIAVLALGIGYAAMSGVTLNIEGAGTISVDDSNFVVHFQEPATVAGDGTVTATVTDLLNAEFTIEGFTKRGDKTTITYTIVNDSDEIAAKLENLAVDNADDTNFQVNATLGSNTIAPGGSTTVVVEVEALKTPVTDDVNTTIALSVEANPVA